MKKSSHRPVARRETVRSRQRGFTLIEVMVALIVLVLGVLGAAAMTLTAIRDSKQSGLRTQASALAYEISDLMRANRYWAPVLPPYPVYPLPQYQEAVFTGAQPTSGVGTCWTTGCVPGDMAKNDFYEWLQKLQDPRTGLPNGAAVICHDKANLTSFATCDNLPTSPIVVKLQWDEKKNDARDTALRTASTTGVVTQLMVVTIDPYQ